MQSVSQLTSKSKSGDHVTKKTVRFKPQIKLPLISLTKSQGGGKQNPIYLFYEQVDVNKDGKAGEPGDKHYKCYHGNRKVLTISKAMNCSLNGTSFSYSLHVDFKL